MKSSGILKVITWSLDSDCWNPGPSHSQEPLLIDQVFRGVPVLTKVGPMQIGEAGWLLAPSS